MNRVLEKILKEKIFLLDLDLGNLDPDHDPDLDPDLNPDLDPEPDPDPDPDRLLHDRNKLTGQTTRRNHYSTDEFTPCICARVRSSILINIYFHASIYVYMYIYIYICLYICIYIYIYIKLYVSLFLIDFN